MPKSFVPSTPEIPVHTIRPGRGWVSLRLGDVWAARELLVLLVWRDIKVRYAQTALGALWAVLQPLTTMVVFSVFFGRLAGIPSDGVPYPLYTFCALLPWQLFASSLTESSQSVVANQRVLTKIYFPRLILPLASVGVSLVDFSLSLAVLVGLLAYYGVAPTMAIVTVPLWSAFAVCTALAVGLWLSAINVRYRDVRYTVPFVVSLWMFATPVAYPSSLVPDAWRPWYALNPMVGVIDGFRWAFLGTVPGPGRTVLVSAAVVMVLLVTGLAFFRRTERTFADLI